MPNCWMYFNCVDRLHVLNITSDLVISQQLESISLVLNFTFEGINYVHFM